MPQQPTLAQTGTPRMRAATNEERGWQILGDWFDQVLAQPVVKTGLAIADIAGKAFDAGIRGQVGREDFQVGNQTIPANEQQVAAIVYHGSPHKFDKFDMSKIGTGEGAQAYGHGLYFAESPQVATGYRARLTADELAKQHNMAAAYAASKWSEIGLPAGKSRMAIQGEIADGTIGLHKMPREVRNVFLDHKEQYPGATYDVDLPDSAIEKMLDWDAPFAQQPKEVQQRLVELGIKPTSINEDTGAYLYQRLAKKLREELPGATKGYDAPAGWNSAREASSLLQQRGIPGIKYFDGSSRAAGKGSRNYVVFSDDLPTIKAVNGVPLSQIGGVR